MTENSTSDQQYGRYAAESILSTSINMQNTPIDNRIVLIYCLSDQNSPKNMSSASTMISSPNVGQMWKYLTAHTLAMSPHPLFGQMLCPKRMLNWQNWSSLTRKNWERCVILYVNFHIRRNWVINFTGHTDSGSSCTGDRISCWRRQHLLLPPALLRGRFWRKDPPAGRESCDCWPHDGYAAEAPRLRHPLL